MSTIQHTGVRTSASTNPVWYEKSSGTNAGRNALIAGGAVGGLFAAGGFLAGMETLSSDVSRGARIRSGLGIAALSGTIAAAIAAATAYYMGSTDTVPRGN